MITASVPPVRLVSFRDPLGHERVGRLDGDRVVELQAATMLHWLRGEGHNVTGRDHALGDVALREAVARREANGAKPFITDLGRAWYDLTKLPFTFAVWASRKDRPPSELLVARLRAAREQGLGNLAAVSRPEAEKLGVSESVVQRYLGNFRYYLEPPDRDGLTAFAERSVPGFRADELSFWAL